MAYNTPAASATTYGVVQVGANITTVNGVISIPQSVAVTATPVFATLTSTGAVTDSGNRVLTTLTAGTNVSITGTSPNLTISASGASTVPTVNVTTPVYVALATDYYIGVNSTIPVVVTLPSGSNGVTYVVKNELGPTSGTITITGALGELFDGALTSVISTSFGSQTFIFRGTSWHLV